MSMLSGSASPVDDTRIDSGFDTMSACTGYRSGMSSAEALRTTSVDTDEAEDAVEEEADVWIDLSKLGTVFSHEGSSLYLRLGALSKSELVERNIDYEPLLELFIEDSAQLFQEAGMKG
jgi:hypothetical protein